MISLYLLYSNDRINEAKITIQCLNDCEEINSCQKILCCDGVSNFYPKGFEVIEVNRPESGFYCWSNLWDVAVSASKENKILYLDCDRILPKNFIKIFRQHIDDESFVFPKYHFKLRKKINLDNVRKIRENIFNFKNIIVPDHRFYESPDDLSPAWHAIRKKNPMSGCVGFTKNGFKVSGGLDPSFQGWGYADTDYFEKTYRLGFNFKAIEMNELHLSHGINTSMREFRLMNLWHGVKFCKKWGHNIHEQLIILSKEINVPIPVVEHCLDNYDSRKFLDRFLDISKKNKIML